MQSIELSCHPSTPCKLIRGLQVEVGRTREGMLALKYSLEFWTRDAVDRAPIPGPCPPCRADRLWQHTCLEAFLLRPGLAGYYEFNFAPSTEWAIYHFKAYREGMSIVENTSPPTIALRRHARRLELDATISLNDLPTIPADVNLCLALSGVIENEDGGLSYWALTHPPGKPDFHHADSFAFKLDQTAIV